MKKWLIALALLIALIVVSTLVFIPGNLRVSDIRLIKASRDAALRNLQQQNEWIKWWPINRVTTPENFKPIIEDYFITVKNIFYDGVDLTINNGDKVYNGKIVLVPFADSIALKCEVDLKTGSDPINKLMAYQEALKLKRCFSTILDSLKAYNENTEKIYNLNIHRTTLKDTSLIALKITTTDSPSTKIIYGLIDELKHYIITHNAKETDFPILNVQKIEGGKFATMVAIATNKPLPDSGKFSYKRMIPYKDKILVAEVKGGPRKIQQAYTKIERYMNDNQLSAPVIPFEYLVTNRSKEADTSKWITTIYTPIR